MEDNTVENVKEKKELSFTTKDKIKSARKNKKEEPRRSFSFLYEDKTAPSDISEAVKIVIFFLASLFLFLFVIYEPFVTEVDNHPSMIRTLFNLYFFVTNQTFLMVHEAGHGLTKMLYFPEVLTILSGTIFQLFFPLLVAFYYENRNQLFSSYVAVYFAGFSLHYTAWYISIADTGVYLKSNELFLDQDGYNDFNYILNYLDVMAYQNAISDGISLLAYIVMFFSMTQIYFSAFSDFE